MTFKTCYCSWLVQRCQLDLICSGAVTRQGVSMRWHIIVDWLFPKIKWQNDMILQPHFQFHGRKLTSVAKHTNHPSWICRCTWRIIPVNKWLITMVSFRPLSGVVPLPNGLNGLQTKGYYITTITGTILQVGAPKFSRISNSGVHDCK